MQDVTKEMAFLLFFRAGTYQTCCNLTLEKGMSLNVVVPSVTFGDTVAVQWHMLACVLNPNILTMHARAGR